MKTFFPITQYICLVSLCTPLSASFGQAASTSGYVRPAFDEPPCTSVSVLLDINSHNQSVAYISASVRDACTDFGDFCRVHRCCCMITTGNTDRRKVTFDIISKDRMMMSAKDTEALQCYTLKPYSGYSLVPTYTLISKVFPDEMNPVCKDGRSRSEQIAAEVQRTNTTPKDGHTPNPPAGERQLIITALNSVGGDISKASKKLNITEKALLRKIKEYGIQMSAQ